MAEEKRKILYTEGGGRRPYSTSLAGRGTQSSGSCVHWLTGVSPSTYSIRSTGLLATSPHWAQGAVGMFLWHEQSGVGDELRLRQQRSGTLE